MNTMFPVKIGSIVIRCYELDTIPLAFWREALHYVHEFSGAHNFGYWRWTLPIALKTLLEDAEGGVRG